MVLSKTSIILGAGGQDGYYLSLALMKKNHKLILVSNSKKNLNHKLFLNNKNIKIINGKYLDYKFYENLIELHKPDYFFFFYGLTSPKESEFKSKKYIEINTKSFSFFLKACKNKKYKNKIIYANSSEIFSSSKNFITEKTSLNPNSIYGITKYYNSKLINYYIEKYKFKIYDIILFNHDSELRGKNFLYKEIINQINNQKDKAKIKFIVNNKYTIRSWGNAQKYMIALSKLIEKQPGSYIFSNKNILSVEKYIFQILKNLKIKKSQIQIISKTKVFDKKSPDNTKLINQIGNNYL